MAQLPYNDPSHTVSSGVTVQVSTAFWKLIVMRDPTDGGNDLTAAAFIMPQTEEFLRTLSIDNNWVERLMKRIAVIRNAKRKMLHRMLGGA